MLYTKSLAVLIFSAVLSSAAAADEDERQWPENVYDCQVITQSGSQGLVTLQTFSVDIARKDVIGLPAMTRLGQGVHEQRDTAASVVQCTEQRSKTKFSDANFQAWVNTLEG